MAKRKITWSVAKASRRPGLPRQYSPDISLTKKTAQSLEGKLYVGAIFTTLSAMYTPEVPGNTPPPFPYITKAGYSDHADVPKGAVCIYAGIVRVEELNGSTPVRAPRHSFVINGRRVLIINLNLFKPA